MSRHQHPPGVLHRKFQIGILGLVNVPQQKAKVQKSPVQPLADILGIAAHQVKMHPGIVLLQLGRHLCQQTHPLGLPGADVNVPGDVGLANLLLRPPHQAENLLRPLPQKPPLLRQGDFPAAPGK